MKRENEGRVVRVYKNLHLTRSRAARRGRPGTKPQAVYSVCDAKTGKVIYHAHRVALAEVEFVVRKAGRERCLREKRKNVHAFAVGILCGIDPCTDQVKHELSLTALEATRRRCEIRLRYKPEESEFFRTPTDRPIRYAWLALLDERGIHIEEGPFGFVNANREITGSSGQGHPVPGADL